MTNESLASPAEPASEPQRTTSPAQPGAPETGATPSGGTTADGAPSPARRRRSRGGRGRGRGGAGGPRPAGAARTTGESDSDAPTEGAEAAPPKADAGAGDAPAAPRQPRPRQPRQAGQGPPRSRAPRNRPAAGGEGDTVTSREDGPSDGEGDGGPETGTGATAAARRRRRRGGRGRRRPGSPALAPSSEEAAEEAGLAKASNASAQRDDALPDEHPDAESGAARRPAARRSRSTSGRTRSARPLAEAAEGEDDETKPSAPSSRMSSRRQRPEPIRVRGRARRREMPRPVKRRTDKRMVITEIDERDQIAVLEGRELVEHYITRSGARSMVGNIYVGRVQNVLPGMEAAFIDIGRGRNGVLYAGEVNYDEEVEGGSQRIEEALKAGQRVLVQVTKDPLGGKGARLTAQVSLPGRFLVFVPNQQVFGISRRLPDEERSRLRDILKPIRPEGHGVIARTAAEGATPEDLEADLKRLQSEWEGVEKRAKKAKPASVVYEEPELTVRVVRDVFTEGEFEGVVTDSQVVFEKVTTYLRDVAPELLDKVTLHEGPLPVMEEYHVTEQVRKALERKVWLPSGGYLVIDRTEAMTVIDVNTGKHVGKTNLEETVTQTNMEAADEIARQLRLRDIGGMIIIDFIDMLLERNRGKVIRAVKSALAKDRTRSQVFDISPLGLLEVTRKKVSAGLVESFSETCPTCEGRGILLTHQS